MELLVWQLIAGAECALVLWLVARLLRVRHWRALYEFECDFSNKCSDALMDIADLDTPKAAHGVKKAVAIAKGALGQ